MDFEYVYFSTKLTRPMKNQRNRVMTDICDLYDKVLEKLMDQIKEKRHFREDIQERLKCHFVKIYWSLKVHLLFYHGYHQSGPLDATYRKTYRKLKELGEYCVPETERTSLPDLDRVIDPASILLEVFSDLVETEDDPVSRGSEQHADKVLSMARSFFSCLFTDSIFKPTCLAKISHNNRSFVGASMAVSHFLQPICLFNRIINLKESLGKAIINYHPMNIQGEWKFEAFSNFGDKRYPSFSNTSPCQNCKMMFRGDRTGSEGPTILGLCAEYCAINQLLPDEKTLIELIESYRKSDAPEFFKLERNYEQCKFLFENYRVISNECLAINIDKELEKAIDCIFKKSITAETTREIHRKYWEIIYRLHIFGLMPECNRYF